MTTRKYSSRAQQTTLSSGITSSDTTMTVGSGANLMGGKTPAVGETYTVVIDPDTALEEIVDVSNYASGNTLTIARGIDGSTAVAHSAGAIVRHMVIGRDLSEANTHIDGTLAVHAATTSAQLRGVISDETGTGSLVFATSPTIATPTLTTPTVTGLTLNDSNIVFEGATADAFETTLTVVDPTADRTITLPDITGTVVTTGDTGTVTGTMIASDTIVNADINSAAGIAATKIAGTAVTLTDTGTVTSTMIANNTIVDADINSSAAIARTKIANPTADVSNGGFKLTDLGTPTLSTDASTKAYVDTSISNLIAGAPATLDTLDEIAAALADTANFSDTVVLKTGSTMSGALAMGTNKITGLGTPTASTDAATKGYIDTAVIAPGNLTGPITSVGSATTVAAQTGTGSTFVMQASPTLTTPNLGTPTAATLTNATGLPISTGVSGLAANVATFLGTPTSANFQNALTNKSGTGLVVLDTSPTITTPLINTITAGTSSTAAVLWSGVTTGSIGIGSGITTGTVSIANANTFTGTLNLGSSTSGAGSKTINLGTGSTTGTTTVNIGSASGATSVVNINGAVLAGTLTAGGSVGTNGYVLSTTGTGVQWIAAPSGLPSQTSNAGKYLTTDGTSASWATVTTDPTADIFMMMGA